MQKLFLIFVLIFTLACTTYKPAQSEPLITIERKLYRVERIDSVNNYYLIFAESEDMKYEIISRKAGKQVCKQISVDNEYHFELSKDLLYTTYTGDKFQPVNYLDLENCIQVDDSTKICREGYMSGLYYVSNVRGLCFIEYIDK